MMKHHASPFLSPLTPQGNNTSGNNSNSNNNNTTKEMEMAWNPTQACVDLQKACEILSDRCLKLSTKWAAEQWMGLPPEIIEGSYNITSTIHDDLLLHNEESDRKNPALMYAKTLLELGEYGHAAAVLSETSLHNKSASIESMNPPQFDLSSKAFYIRAYALYMAGERRKEEDVLELQSEGQKNAVSKNPYLQQLSHELLDAYEDNNLDAFGLHVYGMVLKACRSTVVPSHSPTAQSVLIQSILQFPYNWSAWLDLAELAVTDRDVEIDIEEQIQPILSGHFMYHFFCAHLQAERQSHADALIIYERWMDSSLFGGSPYLLSQHAVCSYHTRNFASAKSLLEDLHRHMPYRLDSMDVFSNILYVQEDSVALSQLAHTAVQVDKYRAETCCIVGNYYSLKQHRAKAVQYFQRALKMDRNFTSAWTLMGHEYVEWKQTANAMEAYRRAVQVAPSDYRAWYGLGQTYELLNMNLHALYYYKQAAQLRPYDARMWCAVGMCFAHLKRTSDAIRAYERALQQDETEGVATQKLASLYRQEGETEKAAQCYMRHLEIRYQATKGVSGSAPESLEKMLQGLSVESNEAEAIVFLANYYRDNGEYDFAGIFCSRLLDHPGPEKEQAKAMLRELRTRKSGAFRTIQTRSKGPNIEESFEFSP